MNFSLTLDPVASVDTDCLVLPFTEGGALCPSAQAIDEASGGALGRLLESRDIDTGIGKLLPARRRGHRRAAPAGGWHGQGRQAGPGSLRPCLPGGRKGPARSPADALPRLPARGRSGRPRRRCPPAPGRPRGGPRELPVHRDQASEGRFTRAGGVRQLRRRRRAPEGAAAGGRDDPGFREGAHTRRPAPQHLQPRLPGPGSRRNRRPVRSR